MKKVQALKTISFLFYFTASFLLVFYIIQSINPQIIIYSNERVIILGLICIFVYLGSFIYSFYINKENAKKIMKATFIFFFIVYIVLISTLTLFDRSFGREIVFVSCWNLENIKLIIKSRVNLIPFKTMIEYLKLEHVSTQVAFMNLVGNVVAFMPFAFFLPLFFKKMKNTMSFIICMLLLVSFVEISQLILATGSLDIDDVILNVLGALILFLVLKNPIIDRFIQKITFQFNQ